VATGQPLRTRRLVSAGARSSSRELQILKAIAEALNGASDVDQALQTTLEQVTTLLGLDAGSIWLTDPQTGRFYSASLNAFRPSCVNRSG
jgi:GAF domain-containing protein